MAAQGINRDVNFTDILTLRLVVESRQVLTDGITGRLDHLGFIVDHGCCHEPV